MFRVPAFSLCLLGSLTAVAAPPAASPLVSGNNAFALELYGQVRSTPGNVCFSPASISTALAMAYAGARGPTAKQMATTLHFDLAPPRLHGAFRALLRDLVSEAPGAPRLRIANRLWVQRGAPIARDFLKLTADDYGAAAEAVDFRHEPAARRTINEWVAKQTAGKIKDLVPGGVLKPLTRLVLTNAVYFQAEWVKPFAKGRTAPGQFTLAAGRTATVPLMREQVHAPYAETKAAQVLELPYRSEDPAHDLAMVVILPRAVDGLAAVEQHLTVSQLAAMLADAKPRAVDVVLPRFKVDAALSLQPTLAAMGMPLAFDQDRADFSGIMTRPPLYISAVLHKAFVAVDEKGTEAAAATAVVMAARGMMRPGVTFRADHPFLFLIRDRRSGSILFLGRLADPTR